MSWVIGLALIVAACENSAGPQEHDQFPEPGSTAAHGVEIGGVYSPVMNESILLGDSNDFHYGMLSFREGRRAFKLDRTLDAPHLQFNRGENNSRWFRLH